MISISNYTDRITKILPTEFVGAFLIITQVANDDLDLRQPLLLSALFVCLILIPIFLIRVKQITQIHHHCVVVLSFLVWAYALGDAFEYGSWIKYDLYRPSIGTVLLVIWGLVPLVLDVEPHKESADDAPQEESANDAQ